MKVHEFFHRYANTPIKNRFVILNFNKLGLMTLSEVYKEISAIEDRIRPDLIREQKLLEVIEDLKEFHNIDVFKDKLPLP